MNIKQMCVLAATVLLLGVAGSAAAASSTTSDKSAKNVLPVFVQVNAQGKITHMDPAYTIQPEYERVLRQTLDKMISKPAHNKDGKAIASQFIISMNMQATPRNNGQYELKFTYVSVMQVPPGNWHWAHASHGRRLTLASDSGSTFASFRRSQMRGQLSQIGELSGTMSELLGQ